MMIRRAGPGDVAALRAIAAAAYEKYISRIGEHARGLGLGEVRLYTNEAMTENIAYYTRHGYAEIRRHEQDGFRRVFFRKPVP